MLNFNSSRFLYKPLIVAVAALTTSITATADDIDVFTAQVDRQNLPNILFVLDYSGSMSEDVYGNDIPSDDTTTLSKFEILKSAVSNLLENNKGSVNVGLGSTYSVRSSGVRWPISDLTANAHTLDPDIPIEDNITVANVIDSLISRKKPGQSTATVNALAEVAAYYRGDTLAHDDSNKPDVWNIDESEYGGGYDFAAMPPSYTPRNAYNFATDTWTPPKYVSPLTNQCQANFIVLISDGQPTRLTPNPTLDTVLNGAGLSGIPDCQDLSTEIFDEFVINPNNPDRRDDLTGNCGPEIVEYLATNDINPDIAGSNVSTFAVGFAVQGDGRDYLELLAQRGKGKFFEANKPEDLTNALNSIIEEVLSDSQNFAELSIDIDPSTFSHSNRAYFSLFTPSAQSGWDGNLKGFFVDDTGLIDINGEKATISAPTGVMFAD